jgi:hypothetical protein
MRQDAKRLKVPSIGPQVVNLRTAEDVGLSFEDRFSRPPMDRIKKLAEKVPHGNLAAPLIRCSSRAGFRRSTSVPHYRPYWPVHRRPCFLSTASAVVNLPAWVGHLFGVRLVGRPQTASPGADISLTAATYGRLAR